MGQYEQHVLIVVECGEGHQIGKWLDSISEKYPFYCDECDDQCSTGKYPWSLDTAIIWVPVGMSIQEMRATVGAE